MNETQYINDKWKYLSENSKDLPLEAFFDLEFPGGNFFIDRETNILVNESTGVKLDNDNLNNILYAHPIYFMIITLMASVVSFQDIFNILNYMVLYYVIFFSEFCLFRCRRKPPGFSHCLFRCRRKPPGLVVVVVVVKILFFIYFCFIFNRFLINF